MSESATFDETLTFREHFGDYQRQLFLMDHAGLGQPSSTRLLAGKLAAATAGHLPAGTQVVTIELGDLAHDIVNALLTGFPAPALREAIEQVLHADALIAVTPLYSGSYNGLFKSFFDVLDPGALAGKTVLIAATGGTAGIPSRWSTRSARCPVTCARSRSPPRSSRPPRTGARRAAPARRSPPGSTGPQPSWPP